MWFKAPKLCLGTSFASHLRGIAPSPTDQPLTVYNYAQRSDAVDEDQLTKFVSNITNNISLLLLFYLLYHLLMK